MNSDLPFKIEPLEGYRLLLEFENKETKIFDMDKTTKPKGRF
jgi:hypothetical protein